MKYDAVVVGAGAGGGVAAYVLARAGKKTLLIERGRSLSYADVPRDHLRNHRLSKYGHGTGPDLTGFPRVFQGAVVSPHEGDYQNNACCVGSGTLVYGGQAWRFHPLDFRMASTYGVPQGSSLADWPISYLDIEPYYEIVEHELGVSGGPPPSQMPPRRDHPMPGVRRTVRGAALQKGADRLGWETTVPPLLINTVPYGGRPACAECQHCVGFACPANAKNGTWNTVIPKALASGNLDLWTETHVTRLDRTDNGEVRGLHFRNANGAEAYVEAEAFFLSCGAIETARLMINSGVGGPQTGRNLQGHYYASACAEMPEPVWDGVGPGVSIATLEFNHGNGDVVGGGMLADDFITLPIVFEKWHRPSEIPSWGVEHKRWMRESYPRFLDVKGPVQEVPSADCRVEVDGRVTDKWGVPVAKMSGTTHPETLRTTETMILRARQWLEAAGATKVWSGAPSLHLSAGQHQAGTCRMGDDPLTSVVDRHGRVHGCGNLFVADGSVHVTNGGFNPVLTIMALAWRTASHAVGDRRAEETNPEANRVHPKG